MGRFWPQAAARVVNHSRPVFYEGSRRSPFEPVSWMVLVVILERLVKRLPCSMHVRQWVDAKINVFDRFDKALRNAVEFRAGDRCEGGEQV
jgi:hypothetical protein